MNKFSIFVFLLLLFSGCNSKDELSLPEDGKGADRFAKTFISNIISGHPEIAVYDIDSAKLDYETDVFIHELSRQLNGHSVIGIKLVECKKISSREEDTVRYYNLGYEYELDHTFMLLTIVVSEFHERFRVEGFKAQQLNARLSELTKFSLSGKSAVQYGFLVLAVFIVLFQFFSLIWIWIKRFDFKTRMIWTFLILVLTIPQVSMDWGIGITSYRFFSLNFFTLGVWRPNLYTPWILSIQIPLGAIAFWVWQKKRKVPPTA